MHCASNSSKIRKRRGSRSNIPKLLFWELHLSRITDADFREYAKNNAIRKAVVKRTSEGYVLIVELTWKEGLHTLYTSRNEPRAWASIDRMLDYLRRHELNLQTVELQLWE
jgi:hypothetical protein